MAAIDVNINYVQPNAEGTVPFTKFTFSYIHGLYNYMQTAAEVCSLSVVYGQAKYVVQYYKQPTN